MDEAKRGESVWKREGGREREVGRRGRVRERKGMRVRGRKKGDVETFKGMVQQLGYVCLHSDPYAVLSKGGLHPCTVRCITGRYACAVQKEGVVCNSGANLAITK